VPTKSLQLYAWTSSPQRCVQGSLRPAWRRRRYQRRAFYEFCLWSLQILQACAVHLANDRGRHPRGLTEAFLLPTVCRCAPPSWRQRKRPRACSSWLTPGARGRRFKEALEQPFWSTLEDDLAARLWRALGRPGVCPCPAHLVTEIIFVQWGTGARRSARKRCSCCQNRTPDCVPTAGPRCCARVGYRVQGRA